MELLQKSLRNHLKIFLLEFSQSGYTWIEFAKIYITHVWDECSEKLQEDKLSYRI